ncbi:glyoxalase superfamily protein [Acidovorax sp. LjRoot118]|uniref:glyoxalase superfamily protein n=1 Tax=Acidovorax sp. LjRoot118 TaxID=3342256 RepID=UPI003ECE6061
MSDTINIERLKRQAHDLKKSTGAKHGHCLEALAKQHGYPNWSALIAAHPEQRAVRPGAAQR